MGKESTSNARGHRRCRVSPWVGKIPWRRKGQHTPVFLPEKSLKQRKLVSYDPWRPWRVSHNCAAKHSSTRGYSMLIYSSTCKKGCRYLKVIGISLGSSGGSDSKESACKVGDRSLILGLRRSPGEGNGNPLQYSCLENFMDRGAWWAPVHGVAKTWTGLSDILQLFSTCERFSEM